MRLQSGKPLKKQVRGRVEKAHFGFFRLRQEAAQRRKGSVPGAGSSARGRRSGEEFPERESRKLEWVTPQEASRRVNEPELKELFLCFDKQMAQTQQHPTQKIVNL